MMIAEAVHVVAMMGLCNRAWQMPLVSLTGLSRPER